MRPTDCSAEHRRLLLASLAQTSLRRAAMSRAGVSMGSFILLVWSRGGLGAALRKVLAVDLLGLTLLTTAGVLQLRFPTPLG